MKHPWVSETMGEWINIGLPIFLLVISISSFVWFSIEVKRKKIMFRQMATWLTLNIIFTLLVIYVLIIALLHIYYVTNAGNIFNMFTHYVFGIDLDGGKQWVILLILGFISYILLKSLQNSLKIARLDKRVDELNKEVAILSGKVNNSINFDKKVAKAPKVTKTKKKIKTKK